MCSHPPPPSARRLLCALVALCASGCLLSTEPCGIDFVEVEGRCVPAVDPPPYRGAGAGDADPEAGLEDGGPPTRGTAGRPDRG